MNQAKKWIMKSEKDTVQFGIALSSQLKKGSIVALIGDLGTGKTALTKAIAEGLGIKEMITSPTFSIVHEYYDGRLPLYHFDVYRIGEIEEMYEIGYEEYFYGEGVCVVEWADMIQELLPEESITITISYGESENERIYYVENYDLEPEEE
ncbi:tRNA (adenosine(37)-N6)-threonylcarbamoyltransferase complex ATPase subunit type 1 TsaE [Sinanaerobacter sp. ZZT-01]|uniref:tRNA (adenosine(37)-N6)-threonylcarbamoyltransferase complex ATPase subunit type 1 TsaE n=1 Tax=Sinanaerobacter sp. ZZT-01 TaxID=3111540 RepID=UPI002D791350|nr:tRNA (adenosine(37)-N6)-threonylcarbamoyltransferase complex ATPase subunit type 1 TsaE [Sinanaerobacter sp. ZZT-01]WRR94407.1 tRNA (adenosine(37)-N6)-threonylcarbamoyltransferase complex ATPase subunit type 1 TsaE [Sinanaerobacter sp. ZZT-01]